MASGITLLLRAIVRPEPDIHVSIIRDAKGRTLKRPLSFVNPDKDRSLAGKKRVKARKAARR
jgi:hypothetical protein